MFVAFLICVFFCAFSDTFYHFIFASASFYQYMAPAELKGQNTFCCIFFVSMLHFMKSVPSGEYFQMQKDLIGVCMV